MPTAKRPLSVEKTSKWLLVSPPTVRDYIARKVLRASRVGRRWLVDVDSVEALLRDGNPPKKPA